LKSIFKILSAIAGTEKIILFEKTGQRFVLFFELEKGSSGILTLEAITKLFENSTSEYFPVARKDFEKLELPDDKIKNISTCRIGTENRNFILLLLSTKKTGFPKKLSSIFPSIKNQIIDKITETNFAGTTFYKEAVDALLLPFYESNLNGNEFFFLSKGITNLLGFSKEELINKKVSLLRRVFPEYRNKIRALINSAKNGKEATIEYRIKDNNGIERFIQHSVYPVVKNGKPVRVVGVLIDITREKNLRERLETANRKFKTLLGLSNELIFSLNRSGYFMLINDQGALDLGYNPGDLIGKHFLEIIDEEDKANVAIAFQKVLKTNDAVSFDIKFVNSLMREIPYNITAVSLRNGNEVTGMIGYGKNLKRIFSEEKKLKELNEKLLEANRLLAIERDRASAQVLALEKLNDLKNEFISNVSHELRTPLASIIGFAETIASDEEMPRDLIREFNQIIVSEGKRLTKLIDDILDFSKLEEGKEPLIISQFDILEVLNNLLDSYSIQTQKKGIGIIRKLPQAEFIIKADKQRIEKALTNIISNAVKFSPSGKNITVSANSFLNEVQIIINDEGIGIPESDLDAVFQKFRKANRVGFNKPGAGIGLALVKQIIDMHKGTITIKSELDIGTEVEIRLPKNKEE
jgi:PAS domain S-box-containing protein